jgi:hypothetical protein
MTCCVSAKLVVFADAGGLEERRGCLLGLLTQSQARS